MKVALVPLLYEEYNYGGVLQFLALQKALIGLGVECEILRINDNTVLCKPSSSVWWKTLAWRILTPYFKLKSKKNINILTEILHERYAKCDEYRKKHYVKMVNLEDIDIYIYDAVICGSDQIWNPGRARKRAFLTFVPEDITKIIYAASLGSENITDYQKKCFKPVVERLDYVSVREKSAKKLLDEFIENKEISVQLDPSLLLNDDDWRSEIENCNDDVLSGKKYIFTYFLGAFSERKEHIHEFANKNNYVIVNIPYASGESIDNEVFGDVQYLNATPGEFLGLIDKAEYVFTDSFHACVFSILFKKQFFVYKRDGSDQMMGRIHTLLENFGIDGRIIEDQDIDKLGLIDYKDVNAKHDLLRKESLDFLRNALKINTCL